MIFHKHNAVVPEPIKHSGPELAISKQSNENSVSSIISKELLKRKTDNEAAIQRMGSSASVH